MKLEKKFQRASQARGITLVALVITIIIIIILATVTINMAFNGGIIDKAELASDMYANDTAYTDSSMANVVGYLDEMLNGVTGGGTDEPEEPENVETFSDIYTETKSYTDSEGKTADKTAEQINEDSSSWGNYSDYNTKNEYEVGNPEYVAEAGTGVYEKIKM